MKIKAFFILFIIIFSVGLVSSGKVNKILVEDKAHTGLYSSHANQLVLNNVYKTANISIATYNILNFPGSTGEDRVFYFRQIMDEIDVDILVIQELLNQGGAELFLNEVLNYNEIEYSASTFINGPDTDNLIFFKHDVVSLQNTEQIETELRDISEYTLSLNKKRGFEFVIYSVHLKASPGGTNENKRFLEISELEEHIENPYSIILGDFNIYKCSEPAYQKLINDFSLEMYDPLNECGNWHDNSGYSFLHTQSTRITQFGGGASGGLDDRFDMILLSESFDNSYKLEYIGDSYSAFGNDGQHFNQDINFGENNSTLDALYYASDHLPVVAKFKYYWVPRPFFS
jgi:endonuclease/exonuclease/phosphatase family metal-dependent hydrolase